MILMTVLACAAIVVACARKGARVDTVPESALGRSTAPGPSDPSAPAPDAAGPREISSGPITGSTSGVAPGAAAQESQGPVASLPPSGVPIEVAPLAADGGVTLPAPVDGGARPVADAGAPVDGGRAVDAGRPVVDAPRPGAPSDGGAAPTTDARP